MKQQNWQGKRVVIIGAARQGIALARYFARQKANVVLNDLRSQSQLEQEIQDLAAYQVVWVLGSHSIDIMDPHPDLVCISGGVPLENPLVVYARQNQIPVSNDTQIFMDTVPCQTVGITGSAGKTTTTTLVGRMANSGSGKNFRKVWVGGNIGDPLINYIDEMQPSDLAILEISSFQSELMTTAPDFAAILNITPNHLDRHGSMENYTAAKAQIVWNQTVDEYAILGRDNPVAWGLAGSIRSRLFSFGFSPLPPGQNGAYVEDGKFYIRQDGHELRIPVENEILLRGEHNRLNVLGACAIAHTIGFDVEAMLAGIKNFRGVPHRLEFVRNWQGTDWYNDSIATAPERTIAAIHSFEAPLILLLGGRDKQLPWEELGKLVHQRVDHVIVFGAAASKIMAAIENGAGDGRPFSITRVDKCQDAVFAAKKLAKPGYVVLFSPGGTSYDEFKDFEERGERFKQWVLEF